MDGAALDRQAAVREWMQRMRENLREYGIREETIRRCRTVGDLMELHSRTVARMMRERDPAGLAR